MVKLVNHYWWAHNHLVETVNDYLYGMDFRKLLGGNKAVETKMEYKHPFLSPYY